MCDSLIDELGGPHDGILAMSTLLHVPKAELSSAGRFFASYADEEFRVLPTPGFEKVDVTIRTEPGRGGNHHPQVMVLRRVD